MIEQKLDEGDYNTPELEQYIVIERKSPQDFYQSITSDHARFKKEILRSKEKKKKFYIFLECSLQEFYSLNWSKRILVIKEGVLEKIVNTMIERYDLYIVECESRELMSSKILETIEKEKKILEGVKW